MMKEIVKRILLYFGAASVALLAVSFIPLPQTEIICDRRIFLSALVSVTVYTVLSETVLRSSGKKKRDALAVLLNVTVQFAVFLTVLWLTGFFRLDTAEKINKAAVIIPAGYGCIIFYVSLFLFAIHLKRKHNIKKINEKLKEMNGEDNS